MNGVINLIKPPGTSSAQAVSFVKRLTGQKVGHAGTLDPDASGVLPIMVGKATSLFDYIAQEEKIYVTEIAFGAATDTQDASGQVIKTGTKYPTEHALRKILPAFLGDVMQQPPAYSAIKQGGKRLYDLARQGVAVQAAPRPIHIGSIDLLGTTPRHGYMLRIRCGKGTYIRTLCHDIGTAVGCPAHMRILIRERTGPFDIGQGITMEELEQAVGEGNAPASWLTSPAEVLAHLPRVIVPRRYWKQCVNGAALSIEGLSDAADVADAALVTLYCGDAFIGLYERRGEQFRVRVMLFDPQGSSAAFS